MSKSESKEQPKSGSLILGGAIIVAIIVGVVSFIANKNTPKELTNASALNACMDVAENSDKLKEGTKVFDKAASEDYDTFTQFGDTVYVKGWIGLYGSERVKFNCHIDTDFNVQKLYAFYGDDQDGIDLAE